MENTCTVYVTFLIIDNELIVSQIEILALNTRITCYKPTTENGIQYSPILRAPIICTRPIPLNYTVFRPQIFHPQIIFKYKTNIICFSYLWTIVLHFNRYPIIY